MTCPECGGDTRVLETYPREEGRRVWRRRECVACGHRFSTNEREREPEASARAGTGPGSLRADPGPPLDVTAMDDRRELPGGVRLIGTIALVALTWAAGFGLYWLLRGLL